jgi:acyl-CoA synthetase (NDP forming)
VLTRPSERQQVLNEAEGLALAQAYGIPVVEHRLCRSEDEAVVALVAVGGLAAIKGCTGAITHKSDMGLVCLNVASEAAARQAWRNIIAAAGRQGVALDGLIVAKMAPGRREMIVGAHRDPTFGPVLTVGDGGKYVEQLPDLQVVMTNATRAEIQRAIQRLRIAPLFKGVRGEAAMDVDALCDALMALGRLIGDPGQAINSVDLNPLILYDAGQGCLAVDAVVVRDDRATKP